MYKSFVAAAVFAVVAGGALASPASAALLTPEERDANREAREATHDERVEAREDRREERTEAREEHKEERAEKRAEKMDERSDKREARFDARWSHLSDKLDNIVSRLSDAGADTGTLVGYMSTLDGHADSVKSTFAALDTAIESGDKDTVIAAKEDVKAARDAMKAYYKETVRPEIKSLVDEIRSAVS